MVKVYLVQHGKSYPKEVDPDRKLTDEGVKETELVAEYIAKLGVSISRIVHSGKTRAKMTSEIFARALNVSNVEAAEGLNPLDDPKIWSEKLNRINEDIMIVGHLPHLSKLTSQLLNVNTEVVEFRYSGVLCLEKGEDEKWIIKWYVRPEIITK